MMSEIIEFFVTIILELIIFPVPYTALYLPLALSVAGAMVRDGTGWADINAALEAGRLGFLEHPYASVFTVLRRSVDALPEPMRSRYLDLAVFPEDVHVPLLVIERLWDYTGGLTPFESRQLLQTLKNKGLLYLGGEGAARGLNFHDLQRDFLQLAADDLVETHANLLAAYTPSPRTVRA